MDGDTKPRLGFYSYYAPCVLGIATVDDNGSHAIGGATHIGDGCLVTARHVVEGREITDLITSDARVSADSFVIHYPSDPNVDLALIESDFNLDSYMKIRFWGRDDVDRTDHIQLGTHLDDWIDDGIVLTRVVMFGYPRIPTSSRTELVAVRGEVNAVVDPYVGSPHPLFILSPIARGGFSGGPVLTETGWLLGVVTSSLVSDYHRAEGGFAAAITVEPIFDLLFQHAIFPAPNIEAMWLVRLGYGVEDDDFPVSGDELDRLRRMYPLM